MRRGEEEGGRGGKVDESGTEEEEKKMTLIFAGFGRGGAQQGESDQPH